MPPKSKKSKPAPPAPAPSQAPAPAPVPTPALHRSLDARLLALEEGLAELQGDLRRIVELLAAGNLDGAKFHEIVNKKQGG